MTEEEWIKLGQKVLGETAVFKLLDVRGANFKPHPYMITSRHVVFASDYHGGILDEYAIRSAEDHGCRCGRKGCNMRYSEHTCDHVAFVQLLCNTDQETARTQLLQLNEVIKKKQNVDGFAFVETDEKY